MYLIKHIKFYFLYVPLMFLAVSTVNFSIAQAQSKTKNMYVSWNVGTNFMNDSDVSEGGITGTFDFDTGILATGALGVNLGDGLRFEGEVSYAKNDMKSLSVTVDTFTATVSGFDGDARAITGMVNLLYDIPADGSVKPFIMGGVGMSKVDVSVVGVSADDTSLATQFGGGNLSLGISYRYFVTDDLTLDGAESEYSSHKVLFGVKTDF